MGRSLAILLLVGSAFAQEPPAFTQKYRVRPLEFELGIPPGWKAEQDHTGMVCQGGGMGFMVSREPFLHDEKKFASVWQQQLGEGGIATKVKQGKTGKYVTYSAQWDTDAAGGRTIHAARVWVPVNEMLYNFSFSAPKGTDMKPLVGGVLKAFKCTAEKPRLKFNATSESLGARVTITLPQGYAKKPQGVTLGGGAGGQYVRLVPGYKEPHVAGTFSYRGIDARLRLPTGGTAGDLKKLTAYFWEQQKSEMGAEIKKLKGKSAKFAKVKGYAVEARAYSTKGLPKRFLAWAGKVKGVSLILVMVVDEREARLHKDLLKQVCSKLEVKE